MTWPTPPASLFRLPAKEVADTGAEGRRRLEPVASRFVRRVIVKNDEDQAARRCRREGTHQAQDDTDRHIGLDPGMDTQFRRSHT